MKRQLSCLFLLSFGVVNAFTRSVTIRSGPSSSGGGDDGAHQGRPLDETTKAPSTKPKKTIITTYEQAIAIVHDCAMNEEHASNHEEEEEEDDDDLYHAVHYLDRNAYKLYPDIASKQALWERAHGSWKLVMTTGSAQCRTFHPPPKFLPFSYAMISKDYFGNGVGFNEHTIWLSLLHKHYYNAKVRQMVVILQDVYLGGRQVTDKVPALLRKKANFGKRPEDFHQDKAPPTFVIIAASDKALIARGNQSGGLAIWSRMSQDIQPVAYKEDQK